MFFNFYPMREARGQKETDLVLGCYADEAVERVGETPSSPILNTVWLFLVLSTPGWRGAESCLLPAGSALIFGLDCVITCL